MTYQGERLVTLHTGEQVSNYSEAWRAECEARHHLRQSLDKRKDAMELVEKKRGPDARLELERLIRQLEPAYVLGLPNKEVRRAYLHRVQMAQGEIRREILEQEVRELYERRKAEALAACDRRSA